MNLGQQRRPLGGTSLMVSPIGMGCAKLGAFWQRRSPAEGKRALDYAASRGVNLFDTADCYARGISERLVGEAMRRHHADDLIVCTKVGLLKTPVAYGDAIRHGSTRADFLELAAGIAVRGKRGTVARCYGADYVVAAVERSLRRLNVDRIDLLLLHAPPLAAIQAREYLPGVTSLVAAGKIRHWGLMCATEKEAQAALSVPGVGCLQVPNNLSDRSVVPAIRDRAADLGVGILGVAPFADGKLISDMVGKGAANDEAIDQCLEFSLNTPSIDCVIVGMSEADHVRSNLSRLVGRPASSG